MSRSWYRFTDEESGPYTFQELAEMFADAMEATRGEAAATGHNLDPKSLQEWYSVD